MIEIIGEIFLIQIYHSNVHENGYNISKGGDVGWKYVNELIKSGKLRKPSEYRVFTKESIEKMRLAKLNKKDISRN